VFAPFFVWMVIHSSNLEKADLASMVGKAQTQSCSNTTPAILLFRETLYHQPSIGDRFISAPEVLSQ